MIVNPKDYFVASNELVVIALVVCWAITAAVDIDKAWSHPARNYVGHLNPCFGWDYAPGSPNPNPNADPNLTPTQDQTLSLTLILTLTLASYFAVAFAGCDVYLAFRYANLEARRTYLLDLDHSLCLAERVCLATSNPNPNPNPDPNPNPIPRHLYP